MRRVLALWVCSLVMGCALRDNGNGVASMEVFPPEVDVITHMVRTGDGITLALHRHTARRVNHGAPVLLCHGMGYNSNIWCVKNSSGLAYFLARKGHDVWRLDFRGCGLSEQAPPATSIEDYALKDLPAAIGYIGTTLQKRGLFVIGHGTGGSAALIYLLTSSEPMVNGLGLIGSPLSMPLPEDAIFSDRALAKRCLVNPLFRYGSFVVDMPDPPPRGWESLFLNPGNMEPSAIYDLLIHCSESVPDGVANQFFDMVETGKLTSPDGKRIYLDETPSIHLPLYVAGGKGDNFASPAAVRAIYHLACSVDKTFRLFCRASGDGEDFGNADLLCGRRADSVVFPEIEAWLRNRVTAQRSGGQGRELQDNPGLRGAPGR